MLLRLGGEEKKQKSPVWIRKGFNRRYLACISYLFLLQCCVGCPLDNVVPTTSHARGGRAEWNLGVTIPTNSHVQDIIYPHIFRYSCQPTYLTYTSHAWYANVTYGKQDWRDVIDIRHRIASAFFFLFFLAFSTLVLFLSLSRGKAHTYIPQVPTLHILRTQVKEWLPT